MNGWLRTAAPGAGYGLTVMSTLFLGNVGLLLATLPRLDLAAGGHLGEVLAFAIIGSLAGVFTGLNLNKAHPQTDSATVVWIWLISLPVARRLAEIVLSVRWDPALGLEAALLAAAVVILIVGAGRLSPERAP